MRNTILELEILCHVCRTDLNAVYKFTTIRWWWDTFELQNINLTDILFRNLLTLSLLGFNLKLYNVMRKRRLTKIENQGYIRSKWCLNYRNIATLNVLFAKSTGFPSASAILSQMCSENECTNSFIILPDNIWSCGSVSYRLVNIRNPL